MDRFELLIKKVKDLSFSAMSNAQSARDVIFSDEKNDIAVIGYLNYASSLICEAESLYFSNYDELEHHDIDEFFNQFNAFISEALTCIATNHSHQVTNDEFNYLKDKYNQSVLSIDNPFAFN